MHLRPRHLLKLMCTSSTMKKIAESEEYWEMVAMHLIWRSRIEDFYYEKYAKAKYAFNIYHMADVERGYFWGMCKFKECLFEYWRLDEPELDAEGNAFTWKILLGKNFNDALRISAGCADIYDMVLEMDIDFVCDYTFQGVTRDFILTKTFCETVVLAMQKKLENADFQRKRSELDCKHFKLLFPGPTPRSRQGSPVWW